jgi:hypothetical protein
MHMTPGLQLAGIAALQTRATAGTAQYQRASSCSPCIQASRSLSACLKLSVSTCVKVRGQARPAKFSTDSRSACAPCSLSTRVKMRYRLCCR